MSVMTELDLYACPLCGAPTKPQRGIHPSLCLPCTEADIGMTYVELRTRVNATLDKGKNRKWQR